MKLLFMALGLAIATMSSTACADAEPLVAHTSQVFCRAFVKYMRQAETAQMPEDPNRATVDYDVQPAKEPAISFVYELDSAKMNTIAEASLFADTDRGWFEWNVQDVEMHGVPRQVDDAGFHGTVTQIRSSPLPISFPYPVVVRHVWVNSARRSGEPASNPSVFACPPPAYESRGTVPDGPVASPTANKETGVARSIPPPFSLDCNDPFHGIHETNAAQPTTRLAAPISGQKYKVGVEVLVGDRDNILGTAIYQSSRREDIDSAALSAQNASSFNSAISYCQKVPSAGVFWSEFLPRTTPP